MILYNMEKKKCYITNFATLSAHDGGGRYRVVRNEAGEELGIEVSGVLTTFDVRNENGGVFHSGSYDKFVDEYFVKNSLNVPLCLYHNDWDIRMVCGVVKTMTKTDSGVEMTGWIPKTAYFYNLIKSQIDNGILQGFSNAGGVIEADYDFDTDTMDIKEFALLHAALVASPADTGATLRTVNTVFRGFEKQEKQTAKSAENVSVEEEPIDNEVGWNW